MNNQITNLGVGQEKKTLRKYEQKLSKNSKVETNIPFTAKELQEHSEGNPGSWKLPSGEMLNRKMRRMNNPKPVSSRIVPVENNLNKQEGRFQALQILEKQLENGRKPAKTSWINVKDKMLPVLPYGVEKVGDMIDLTPEDKDRIRIQIANLEKKQERYNIGILIGKKE